MPVIYETTATIAENGHLLLDIDDLSFEQGTEFLIKLIPQSPINPESFKRQMQTLIDQCAQKDPYKGMTNPQILAELRRQREEMYGE